MRQAVIGGSLLALVLLASGCGSSASSSVPTDPAVGACPGESVPVVVSVDQWGDITSALGGGCATVTTVLKSSSVDPHDYEPTAADLAAFSGAKIVVLNGVDYDHWAADAAAAVDSAPIVVDGGEVVGVGEGENPHLWYSPTYVFEIAAAITDAMKEAAPGSASYFDARAKEWQDAMQPYLDKIAAIKAGASGKSYGATEGVFDYMAQAVGLTDVTPQGWRNAAANERDPAPGDIAAFNEALQSKAMTVLIYNTQTEGSVTTALRSTAEGAGVPVVEVTETVAPGFDTFQAWQLAQLDGLARGLGVG